MKKSGIVQLRIECGIELSKSIIFTKVLRGFILNVNVEINHKLSEDILV